MCIRDRIRRARRAEDYLVAGRIRLGTLLDLIAGFLDALDGLFELYPEEAAGAPRIPAQAPLPRGPQRLG